MARTALTPVALPSNWSTTPVSLNLVASDATNNNSVSLTGDQVLLVQNTDTVAHAFTVHSSGSGLADGRTGDIAAFSVPAGGIYVTQRFPIAGWIQSDGTLWIDTTSPLLKFAVLTLPR